MRGPVRVTALIHPLHRDAAVHRTHVHAQVAAHALFVDHLEETLAVLLLGDGLVRGVLAGVGASRSRSSDVIELIVVIRDTASAPPRNAARAGLRMSVIFGVSFTMHGRCECFFTQRATISMYSGTWPTAEPMPRSLMPCGQPKFSSTASAPVSSTIGRMYFHDSSSHGTISDTIMARSGQSRLIWRISARFVASGRSVISSMLLRPAMRWPFHCTAP